MNSSRRALWRVLLSIAACVAVAGWIALHPNNVTAAEHTRARAMQLAITIDDLPGSVELPPGYTRSRLMGELLATLTAHHVRSATGFVIGQRADADADARAALSMWTRAGFEVGSHTYSHPSMDHSTALAYVADVTRMEPLMRELERESGQSARYFRYPFLEEGHDEVARRTVHQALAGLGYADAPVSVDFADWAWAEPQMRCMASKSQEPLRGLRRSYLEFAASTLAWSRYVTDETLGRPLVQVLLLHANVATAENLDALLSEFEQAGVQFVPLSEALRDPLYSTANEAGLGNVLTAASHARGLVAPVSQEPPLARLDAACR